MTALSTDCTNPTNGLQSSAVYYRTKCCYAHFATEVFYYLSLRSTALLRSAPLWRENGRANLRERERERHVGTCILRVEGAVRGVGIVSCMHIAVAKYSIKN